MGKNWLQAPFKEAVEHFRQKAAIPTDRWDELTAEQHDAAFTVAGLTKVNLLNDLKWLVGKSIEDGTDIETFKDQFRQLIEKRGWSPKPLPAGPSDYRLRIILETNVRRSQAAGRREQMLKVADRRPYWMWVWRDSPNPRLNHQALDGKVFLATDPFWKVAFPPCGFGCKCGVVTLSAADMKRRGLTVSKAPDPKSIAQKGFQVAPGSTPKKERGQILREGLKGKSPELRAKVLSQLKAKGVL